MSNIDIIKESLDIVEIASTLTNLRKSGRSFSGSCPYHSERTPSFYVYPKNNRFKCFGCGASGSVIDLFAFSEEISFAQAVRQLEDQMGLQRQVPKKLPKIKSEQFSELGLHPKSIRELYAEDEDMYRFIVGGKIREKIESWRDMSTRTDEPLFLLIIEEKINYFHDMQEVM